MDQYVRIELPGGYVRVVSKATYTKLVESMKSLALALENAEYIQNPETETIARIPNGARLWRSLLSSEKYTNKYRQGIRS